MRLGESPFRSNHSYRRMILSEKSATFRDHALGGGRLALVIGPSSSVLRRPVPKHVDDKRIVTELLERVLKLLAAHRDACKPLPGEAVREGRDLGGRAEPRHRVLEPGYGEAIPADARKAGRRPGHHEPT